MVLGNNGKTEEEKIRERTAIKDSASTGTIEQQAMQKKQKEREQTRNKLFDVEGARKRIQQGLLGYKKRFVPYQDPETENIEVKQVKEETRNKQLCNEDGASVFMDEANSFLNHNTISTYLEAQTIERKAKGTLKPIYKQIVFNHHKFNISSTSDAGDIVSIIRNPMIDAMNKARGGRLIKNQEKIRVEKESVSREGSSDDENQGKDGIGGLF